MQLWKQLLLSGYYHASLPVRAWNMRRMASRDRLPTIVLFWHRIADDRATPWTTSNAMFERQIRWLDARFQFVSLAETQRRVRQGCNRRPCVCLTFDDGYAENCQRAIPLLVREHIPCTYFVTLRNVREGVPFLHDRALGHPATPNSLEQIRAMAASGVEIGSHTYTHTDLATIDDADALRREIVEPKEELERLLGREVRYLSFPFGQPENLTPAAFELARRAGYAGVCSAYGGYNWPGDDPFHLQRIAVDTTMIHLKNWATMDPRKLRTPRYEWRGLTSPSVSDSQAEVPGSESLAPSP